ncbi:MAG: AraC family transcriptional regulator [Ginsengibacter sp.]
MKNYYKYLPITETEKDWGFYLTTVGYTKTGPKETYPIKGHPPTHAFTWNKGRILNGYYLVFISQGKGVFESEKTTSSVISEGTCFLLFPHVWHRYKPDIDLGWEEFWVGFKGSYPDHIMNKYFSDTRNPFVDVGLNESLLILFNRLLEAVQHATPGYCQIISGITLEILGQVHAISVYKEQSENPTKQIISKAMFLLRKSLDQPVNMKHLSDELLIGYSKFRKEFKNITGLSPYEYHLSLRMNMAKELLNSTTLNISEIAYQTGFESVFYFSKLFKRKVGFSPKHYRLHGNYLHD